MDRTTLNRVQSRQLDRLAIEDYGIDGLVLMENAGRGVADKLCEFGITGPVVICCGKGNNAGDGFVIARHLDLRGFSVRVLLWADPGELAGDAAANYRIIERSDISIEDFASGYQPSSVAASLAGASWVVDALLGTGARGEPRPPLDTVIDQLNAAPAPKLAVDLPSGLDCDTGIAARHTIRAKETCTFVAAKPGFYASGADEFTGPLHILDIGVPRKLVAEILSKS